MTYLPADNSFPEKLRRWSQEPLWWAAIASLAAHSLLWVVLPFLPSSEKTEQDIQKPVGLIQLTPEEQSRLPDFAAPLAATPTFPTPRTNGLPGGPPGQGFSLSPLPNQGFGRLPSSTLPPFFVPSVPPLPPLSSFRSRTTNRFPQQSPFVIPPPPPASLPPATPARPALPDLSPRFTTSGRSLNVPGQTPSSSIPSLSATPSPDTPPLFARPPASTRFQLPSPTTSPAPSPTSPGATPNGSTATPSPGEASPSPSPTSPTSPAQVLSPEQQLAELRRQQPQLFTFDPRGTSQNRADLAYANWFNRMERPLQDPETLKKIELTRPYPPTACLLAAELENKAVTSVVGVMVDPDNKIVGEPEVLLTGGYGIFAATVLDIARTQTFNNTTDTAQPYLVQVTFTYDRDVCTPAP